MTRSIASDPANKRAYAIKRTSLFFVAAAGLSGNPTTTLFYVASDDMLDSAPAQAPPALGKEGGADGFGGVKEQIAQAADEAEEVLGEIDGKG